MDFASTTWAAANRTGVEKDFFFGTSVTLQGYRIELNRIAPTFRVIMA